MLKTVRKSTGREISQSVIRSAQAEKKFTDTFTKISLDGVNTAFSINNGMKIVEKYSKVSKLDYATYMKLYMLQNYSLNMKYFKGAKSAFNTLKRDKSLIKRITKKGEPWKTTDSLQKTFNMISDFINELKTVSKPIQLISTTHRGSLDEALPYLNSVERNFITSPINTITELPSVQKITNGKDKDMKRTKIDSNLFIENSEKSVKELCTMFPSLCKKTITNYKSWYNSLKKGKNVSAPSNVLNSWRNYCNKETTRLKNTPTSTVTNNGYVQSPIKKFAIFNTKTNEISNITGSLDFVKGFKACLDSSSNLQNKTPFKLIEFKFL